MPGITPNRRRNEPLEGGFQPARGFRPAMIKGRPAQHLCFSTRRPVWVVRLESSGALQDILKQEIPLHLRAFARLFAHIQLLPVLENGEETTLVGGQAVMEGVMMRSPHSYCVAVRKPNGEIVTEESPLAGSPRAIRFSSCQFSAAWERSAMPCRSG